MNVIGCRIAFLIIMYFRSVTCNLLRLDWLFLTISINRGCNLLTDLILAFTVMVFFFIILGHLEFLYPEYTPTQETRLKFHFFDEQDNMPVYYEYVFLKYHQKFGHLSKTIHSHLLYPKIHQPNPNKIKYKPYQKFRDFH